MGCRDFDGANDSLSGAAWTWPGYPFTMSIWHYWPVPDSGHGTMISYRDSASSNRFVLRVHRAAAVDGVTFYAESFKTPIAKASASWTMSYPDIYQKYWIMVTGVFGASNSRKLYVNGGLVDTDVTNITVTPPNRLYVGENGTVTHVYFTGKIAHAAVWDVALTDNEIQYGLYNQLTAAKRSGGSPLRVRPESLMGYWPIHGMQDPEPNIAGNSIGSFTVNGPPAASGGPPVPAPQW